MRARFESWMATCALVIGCGDGSTTPHGADGAIDTLGDTEGATETVDDDGFDDDAGDHWDLGAADDGGPPAVDGCEDEAPVGFPIPIDPSCETEPQIGMFTPVVEWAKSEWTTNAGSRQSVTTPIVVQLTDDDGDGDIDDDDMPDVAYVTYDNGGMLRAIAGDGSAEVLSVSVPAFTRRTGLAAADIDGDGIVEIVSVDGQLRVVAFEHDGTPKWTSAAISNHVAAGDNHPAISDMNGDGVPEIVVGRAILDVAGNVIATGEHGRGSFGGNGSLSFAVDLDDDGMQEVVVGNALYRLDGSAIWHNGASDGFPAVADLDGDLVPEIVVVNNGQVRAQSSADGTILWTASIPGGQGGPPTIADYDGDGMAEIGVAGSSSYTVFEGDGAQRWTRTTQDGSSGVTGSAVFDFEGDGVADVVYADETRLWVFAGHDGTVKLSFDEHSSGTRIEYPIIADVDGDGEVEIAYVNEQYQVNYRGVTVVGDASHSWQPGRKIWNQHAYHITNVGDDGRIPAVAGQNWKSYNNFRSGDLSPPDGLKIPSVELFASPPCADACEADRRTLWVQIGNGGAGILGGGADIEVRGVTPAGDEVVLETIAFTDVLAPGEVSDGIAIEVEPAAYPTVRFVATAHEILCNDLPAEIEIAVAPCPLAPPQQG